MTLSAHATRRALRLAALSLPLLAAPLALMSSNAHAEPVVFVPFDGSGGAVLFDAMTGDGGWVGSITQSPFPVVADPLSLVSFVTFNYSAAAQTLTGQFEFTRSSDLADTLFGLVSGTTTDADVFASGGQFSLDYTVLGGTGDFAGASGYGLSFFNFDPNAAGDNYTESGLLVLAVPEPGGLPLVAGALLALWGLGRQRQQPVRVGSASTA